MYVCRFQAFVDKNDRTADDRKINACEGTACQGNCDCIDSSSGSSSGGSMAVMVIVSIIIRKAKQNTTNSTQQCWGELQHQSISQEIIGM